MRRTTPPPSPAVAPSLLSRSPFLYLADVNHQTKAPLLLHVTTTQYFLSYHHIRSIITTSVTSLPFNLDLLSHRQAQQKRKGNEMRRKWCCKGKKDGTNIKKVTNFWRTVEAMVFLCIISFQFDSMNKCRRRKQHAIAMEALKRQKRSCGFVILGMTINTTTYKKTVSASISSSLSAEVWEDWFLNLT